MSTSLLPTSLPATAAVKQSGGSTRIVFALTIIINVVALTVCFSGRNMSTTITVSTVALAQVSSTPSTKNGAGTPLSPPSRGNSEPSSSSSPPPPRPPPLYSRVRDTTADSASASTPPLAKKWPPSVMPYRGRFHQILPTLFGILPGRRAVDEEQLGRQTVLEIGANVGAVSNEPGWKLYRRYPAIRKVFVEPIPTLYRALINNSIAAGIKNATFVNAALIPRSWKKAVDGSATVDMYCWKMKPDGTRIPELMAFPAWFTQLCSMNRRRLLFNNTKIPVPDEKYIVKHEIPAMSVKALMHKYNVIPRSVSYVQIDVEGFDDEVVLQLPLQNPCFRPVGILYEHELLNNTQLAQILTFLTQFGYELVRFKERGIHSQNHLYMLRPELWPQEARFQNCAETFAPPSLATGVAS